jgi:hypothetical protein
MTVRILIHRYAQQLLHAKNEEDDEHGNHHGGRRTR